MSKATHEAEILHTLHELSGWDYEAILSYLSFTREEFVILDKKALSFLENSSDHDLQERFRQNQTAYTDNEPAHKSVFLYFDLSTSVELLKYIIHLRSIIEKCIGTDNIRYSDLRQQHSTVINEFLGNDLKINSELLEKVRTEYEPTVKALLPFNLIIVRPHLIDTGGIVLEGIVYSQQFYKLRETASQKNLDLSNGRHRQIPKIVHSTIGYIAGGTSNQLIKLFRHFESMRTQPVSIPIRIRDIRIIATKNKQLIGKPIIIPFQGTRSSRPTEKDLCSSLQTIQDLSFSWSKSTELKNFVLEEILYLIESNYVTSVQILARKIIEQL